MKKEQQYFEALSFLTQYKQAISNIELSIKFEATQLLKHPKRQQQIKYFTKQSKYHRMKRYQDTKRHNVQQFTDHIMWKYLPRFRFTRNYRQMIQQLKEGIKTLQEKQINTKIE